MLGNRKSLDCLPRNDIPHRHRFLACGEESLSIRGESQCTQIAPLIRSQGDCFFGADWIPQKRYFGPSAKQVRQHQDVAIRFKSEGDPPKMIELEFAQALAGPTVPKDE